MMEINKKGGCNLDKGNKVRMSLDIIINFVHTFDPNKNRSSCSHK